MDGEEVKIYGDGDPGPVYEEIRRCPRVINDGRPGKIDIEHKIARKNYLEIIEKLRRHILRGDCYEINFCQVFFQQMLK